MTFSVIGSRWPAYLVVAATLACTAAAYGDVYRCTTNGSVTYTDAPCAKGTTATAPEQRTPPDSRLPLGNPVAIPAQTGPADFYGVWSGQAQYQATVQSRPVDEAHAVIDLVFTIDPKGKLTGASRENGCNALGFASPGFGPTLNLDVTLSRCRYAGFNRRFTGTFALPPGRDYATVSLLAYEARPGVPAGMYEIKATMRR